MYWKKVQDKGLGAPCREEPLEKFGLEPAVPNRLADRKHCALSTHPNPVSIGKPVPKIHQWTIYFCRWGFGWVDKAQCFRSARRFSATGSSPDFSGDFSRHGAPRPVKSHTDTGVEMLRVNTWELSEHISGERFYRGSVCEGRQVQVVSVKDRCRLWVW